ncbi:MAG: hypothetical protein AB1659_06465 [Thermodesulfobacteriota bacterium]
MGLKKNPVFRKIIIPWYDSMTACIGLGVAMSAVFIFGLVGVSVSYADESFRGYVWLPSLLMVLSAVIILSTGIRIARLISERR